MSLWNDNRDVMLVAGHRGARRVRPENTVNAFLYAMDAGVDMVETDIRQSRDGALVLMHDAKVDRTTDGSGNVRDMTLKELRTLNAAAHDEGFDRERIPLLEELLEMAAGRDGLLLNLELKEYPCVEGEEMAFDTVNRTVEMVEKYGLGDRIIFNSFSAGVLRYIRRTWGRRYPLHGYYPFFILNDDDGNGDTPMDVACLFHMERKDGKNRGLEGEICPESWFNELIRRGIEPWIGAGVRTYDDLKLGFERGARLVTTDSPETTLDDLRRMGHHG